MKNEPAPGTPPRQPLGSFDDLKVFSRAYAVSLEIHKLSQSFSKNEQYGGLADQVRRASKSICANIAEGFAKRNLSSAEFKRFLMIAFGSAEETRVWLRYCRDLEYLSSAIYEKLNQEYIEVGKMIYHLHRSWEK